MNNRCWMVALALAVLGGAASAQNLKPGLWEVTQKAKGDAQMDKEMAEMQKEMASMSPAERKQMEAMMGGMKMGPAAGGGISTTVCMTRDMVERNEMPTQQGDCTTTKQSRSGNTMKFAFSCTQPPSTGEGQVTIASPQAYRSVVTVSSTTKGKAEKMTMEGGGKWLADDCGKVKPIAPPKR